MSRPPARPFLADMPHTRTRHARLPAIAAAAALGLPCGVRAELIVDTAVGLAYDTNVSRAELADDIRPDGALHAHGGVAWRIPVGDADASLQLGVALRGA